MIQLTERDKRTIRRAAVGLSIYLVLFFGFRGWKHLEAARADYEGLLLEAETLSLQVQEYDDKALLIEKLQRNLQVNVSELTKATVVGEVSAAIQKAAQAGSIQLGPIRESPARASAKELASMQLEGVGPVPALMTLLHRLNTLGYPVIVDSLLLTPEPSKPGMMKLNLTIVIMDFEQWKKEEGNA
jgi:hypothetical protein